MTRAEEAGQQPVRPVPAPSRPRSRRKRQSGAEEHHADAVAAARPGRHAVSEEDVEALELEMGEEDLARPGDPDELARVENARRRLADLVLVEELAAEGFCGVQFEMFVIELSSYGIAALMAWMRTGQIARQCAAKGRPVAGGLPDQWSPDDRLEIAVETTARALNHFIGEVLIPGRWDPGRGASLKTFFVGSCVLQFPNVYSVWRTEQRPWKAVDVIEPGTEDAAIPLTHGASWSDPTAENVIRRELTQENLDAIKDSRTRKAAEMVMDGYSFAEAGAATGLSAAAVEGRLYRLRRRLR